MFPSEEDFTRKLEERARDWELVFEAFLNRVEKEFLHVWAFDGIAGVVESRARCWCSHVGLPRDCVSYVDWHENTRSLVIKFDTDREDVAFTLTRRSPDAWLLMQAKRELGEEQL